jgi:hypothetical protein
MTTSSAAPFADEVHRLRLASANGEPAEVIHELTTDLVAAMERAGLHETARGARRTAATLPPMFGLQAGFDRARQPWWRRRRWTSPDYRTRADLYRSDVPF